MLYFVWFFFYNFNFSTNSYIHILAINISSFILLIFIIVALSLSAGSNSDHLTVFFLLWIIFSCSIECLEIFIGYKTLWMIHWRDCIFCFPLHNNWINSRKILRKETMGIAVEKAFRTKELQMQRNSAFKEKGRGQ